METSKELIEYSHESESADYYTWKANFLIKNGYYPRNGDSKNDKEYRELKSYWRDNHVNDK